MKRTDILAKLDAAIRARDPRLAQQLRPGLDHDAIARRTKNMIGEVEPLFELYGWHDGTEALRYSEGSAPQMSLLELSIVPEQLCILQDLEGTLATFDAWQEIARYHRRVEEAVGRYFPFLWDSSDTWFTIDLKPSMKGRIVYFELQNDIPFKEAYSTFDEFLLDVLRANETGGPLRFFEEGLIC